MRTGSHITKTLCSILSLQHKTLSVPVSYFKWILWHANIRTSRQRTGWLDAIQSNRIHVSACCLEASSAHHLPAVKTLDRQLDFFLPAVHKLFTIRLQPVKSLLWLSDTIPLLLATRRFSAWRYLRFVPWQNSLSSRTGEVPGEERNINILYVYFFQHLYVIL